MSTAANNSERCFSQLKRELGSTIQSNNSEIIQPVPNSAPPPPKSHKIHGMPSAIWTYRDNIGSILGHVARFDRADREKVVLPLTYRCDQRGTGWRWKGWPDGRPLYGLDRLSANPGASVLIVEGEKAADAAQVLFPDFVAMCWQGGANTVAKVDWTPLVGRSVAIIPDADDAGFKAAHAVRNALAKSGVKIAGVAKLPLDLPKGWDVADAFPSGFSLSSLQRLISTTLAPQTVAHDTDGGEWPAGFTMRSDGLWFQPRDANAKPQWICSPFDVAGEARDPDGNGWSVVIRFKDRDQREKTAILSKGKLTTASTDLRRDLADMGLNIARRSPNSGDPLADCLLRVCSDRRITLCGATGWVGNSFVLPTEVIGPADAEPALFTGEAKALHFGRSGDMATWQSEIAARAVGNSRALFCLSLAFAAPLLRLFNMESGGFHIRGGSSSGKSTLAIVAGSVWGGGGPLGFAQSWRATANGLETMATGHCDTFMALDELAQLVPDEAGNAAYMLSNGQAKARLKADGTARSRAQWRCLFLSTGEISLADHMKAARSGSNVMAGQELRVIDLKADAGWGHGAWENIHGFPTGAEFSDALKRTARQHYGHAGSAFVRVLIDGGDTMLAMAKDIETRFLKLAVRAGDTGQIHRGACRFALVAAAGELASVSGIVPWLQEQALSATLSLFNEWATAFGRSSAREETTVLRRMIDTIQTSGSRFSQIGSDDWEADAKGLRPGGAQLVSTLGIKAEHKIEGVVESFYLFHSAGWAETFKGLDAQFAGKMLKARGYLITDEDGKRLTKKKKISGQPWNMYWVNASILSHELDSY